MTNLFSRIQQVGAALAVAAASISFSPDADAQSYYDRHDPYDRGHTSQVCTTFKAHSDHGSVYHKECRGDYYNRGRGSYGAGWDNRRPTDKFRDAIDSHHYRNGYHHPRFRGYGHGHRGDRGPSIGIGVHGRKGGVYFRFDPN